MPEEVVTANINLLLALGGLGAPPIDSALTVANLRRGQILCRREAPITHIVFPFDAVVSLVTRDANTGGIETGVIGREGCVGVEALLGLGHALADAVVQMPGAAVSLPAPMVVAAAQADAALRDSFHAFLGTLLGQVMQSAACNRLHSVEARCCRWLLAVRDRADRDELPLTHEFLAEMLGVRRPTVTLVLQSLQQAGLINGGRGRIAIVDRVGLARAACACHAIMNRLLHQAGLSLSPV